MRGIGLGMARGLARPASRRRARIDGSPAPQLRSSVERCQVGRRCRTTSAMNAALRASPTVRPNKAAVDVHGRATSVANSAASTFVNAGIHSHSRLATALVKANSGTAHHPDQPHQRLPVLAGGLSRDEGRRRRQDHQYRFDDVDLRRELRAGLCREQRRHRAVHPLLRLRLGRRQHPGQRRAAGLDRHRSDQARPRQIDACRQVLARTPAARWGAIDDSPASRCSLFDRVGFRHRHRHSVDGSF